MSFDMTKVRRSTEKRPIPLLPDISSTIASRFVLLAFSKQC
jgi:hypothetical protein